MGEQASARADGLTIGIALRNEEHALPHFLKTLAVARRELAAGLKVETVFCLNGSTDSTEEILRDRWNALLEAGLNPTTITSAEGKLTAQNAIAKNRGLSGPICFLDADISLDSACLRVLWEALERLAALHVVYAQVIPRYRSKPTPAQRLQMMHYNVREKVYRRRHLHGRAFMIRSWDIPDFTELVRGNARLKGIIEASPRSLRLERGPQIDDVFLSRHIAHRFGMDAIAEVAGARVFFVPPATFGDFYAGLRRLRIEIHRQDLLFEEHRHLKANFDKRLDRRALRSLPAWQRCSYSVYQFVEAAAKKVAECEILMADWGLRELGPLWPALTSTKVLTSQSAPLPGQTAR